MTDATPLLPVRLGAPKGSGSLYTDEVADAICERLEEGTYLSEICRDPTIPSVRTVYDWRDERPDFAARIARAREIGEEVRLAETRAIADGEGLNVEQAVALTPRDKLRVWQRFEELKRWNPKRWGELKQLEVSGGVAHAHVHVVIPPDPIEAARAYQRLINGEDD